MPTTPFTGKGQPISDTGFTDAAQSLGVKAAELWAVFHVETRGFGFLTDRRPLILFERHKFHAATKGKFSKEPNLDISNKTSGGYGAAGAYQYERLARAIKLDRIAALESASWGVGQVMGFNAGIAGYPDVEAMVTAMQDSEDEQLAAVARFLTHEGLEKHLQTHNWAAFALAYNGSKYAENEYDTRLKSSYDRFNAGPLPNLRVRTAQACLSYLGYEPNGVDGVSGKFTRSATAEFQKASQITSTGELDDKTYAKLLEAAGF